MSKKKGFTLVELMAVIVLISAILLLIVSTFTKAIASSKEKAYQIQIDSLELAAKKWAMENPGSLSKYHPYILMVNELKTSGYIKAADIVDPRTNENIDGCIEISYDEAYSQYTYEYTDEWGTCHPPS